MPKSLPRAPFTAKQAKQYGFGGSQLKRMVEKGEIERVGHGLYIPSQLASLNLEQTYQLATLICKTPSAICLLSALEHYNLTDEIPKKTWIMVPQTKRVSSTKVKTFRFRKPNWEIGIVRKKGYWMTSLERTIVDCLVYQRFIGTPTAAEGLKNSLKEKKTSPQKIFLMAKKLNSQKHKQLSKA